MTNKITPRIASIIFNNPRNSRNFMGRVMFPRSHEIVLVKLFELVKINTIQMVKTTAIALHI
jgi:hypothetical protein